MMRPPRRVLPTRYRRHSHSPSSLSHATAPRPRPASQVGLAGALRWLSGAVATARVPRVRSPFSRSQTRLHVRASEPSNAPGWRNFFTRALGPREWLTFPRSSRVARPCCGRSRTTSSFFDESPRFFRGPPRRRSGGGKSSAPSPPKRPPSPSVSPWQSFFFLSHASDGHGLWNSREAVGGETVLQACRVVAGCRWVTADAQEPCCGVAVDARGSKSDSLPRAR